MDYTQTANLLKALGHPVRLRMVQGLLNNECHVDKIVQKLNLPQSTISQHLNVLKQNNIVVVRKEGVRTCYKVAHPKVESLLKILSHND